MFYLILVLLLAIVIVSALHIFRKMREDTEFWYENILNFIEGPKLVVFFLMLLLCIWVFGLIKYQGHDRCLRNPARTLWCVFLGEPYYTDAGFRFHGNDMEGN